MELSIIIVTYNSAHEIGACLDSVRREGGELALEVMVVDNASRDVTVELIRRDYPWVTLIANTHNAGFPGANNQAIALATGRYLVLLNPDTIVLPNALHALVRFMDAETRCGVCGPVQEDEQGVVYPDLRDITLMRMLVEASGLQGLFPRNLPAHRQEAVSGACLVMRQALVAQLGVLDEALFWCEDVEYCRRIRDAGLQVCIVADAHIVHIGGQSAKSNIGLVLEKQYTSKIGYLNKHCSARERRAFRRFFRLELLLRYLKWSLMARFRPSEEAQLRKDTLYRLYREMPHLWG